MMISNLQEKGMGQQQGSAFITTRKGFCYLTIKCGRRNFHVMRIRNYTLDAEDKRHMRRLYPEVVFDWKKIALQLAEKREVCRSYRSRRRTSNAERCPRDREAFYAVYEPGTRTVYASGFATIVHRGRFSFQCRDA
jgi:hypothetical protein